MSTSGLSTPDLSAPGPGLRERKKLRTQQELKAVALRLFVEHGFDEVTIDDIAAAAEVSKSTFYRYFESKEDVLLGGKAEALGLLSDALSRRPADEPPVEAARQAYLEVAALFEYDREQKLAVATISRSTPSLVARNLEHQAAFEQLLRDDFSRRMPGHPSTLDTWVLAAQVIAVMHAAVEFWLAAGGTQDITELMDEALRGLVVSTTAYSPATPDPGKAHR